MFENIGEIIAITFLIGLIFYIPYMFNKQDRESGLFEYAKKKK